MADAAVKTMSVEAFFEWQLGQEHRYELVEGVPVKMMSGASHFHDAITVNLIAMLRGQLRGTPCRVVTADTSVRTRIRSTRRPDVIVNCEPLQPKSYEARNPRLVVEVLSPSNTGIAWARKLEEYRRREGLTYILQIDSQRIGAILLTRSNAAPGAVWEPTDYDTLSALIELPDIGCKLAMAGIYEDLDFDALPTEPSSEGDGRA